jgi:HTH-type transcriptional regulator / antitoxin HigA
VTDNPAVLQGPGPRISQELEARGWSQKDLAEVLGRPLQAINEIVNKSKQVTPETAVQLGEAFGNSAEFWANLEALYRVRLAKKAAETSDVERRSRLFAIAPVGELIRRGWIQTSSRITELERAVCEFLEIRDLREEPTAPVAKLRHTPSRDPETRAQVAWIKRASALVRDHHVGPFDKARFNEAMPRLFDLAQSPAKVASLPGELAALGVHFVVVPHLPKTYLDGAAFRVGNNPVIALTLRYDRLDNLWFTFAHEAAHVARGDAGVMDDRPDRAERKKDPTERAADAAASDWLLDASSYETFREATADEPTRQQIESFALRMGRHPSIIVGRLQHDDVISWSQHRWAHEPIRSWLMPWIDQVPRAA